MTPFTVCDLVRQSFKKVQCIVYIVKRCVINLSKILENIQVFK